MAKNIVFCADGTWNNPNEDENSDQSAHPTNVYKLFLCLDGALATDSLLNANDQDKELAYRRGAEAWYRYRKTTVSNPFSLRHLADVVTDLPGFLSHRSLQDT